MAGEWQYYDKCTGVTIIPSGVRDRPIEITLPSSVALTVDQATQIGNALLRAAREAGDEEDAREY